MFPYFTLNIIPCMPPIHLQGSLVGTVEDHRALILVIGQIDWCHWVFSTKYVSNKPKNIKYKFKTHRLYDQKALPDITMVTGKINGHFLKCHLFRIYLCMQRVKK